MLLLLALACQKEPDAVADTGTPFEPSPYIFDELDPPVPGLDESALEAAILGAVDIAYSLNARPAFSAYHSAIADMESGCPDYYEADGNVYWYDQCTTSTGAQFDGYGFYNAYDAYDAGDGALYYGEAFSGVARVTTSDGASFVAGGSIYDLRAEADGYTTYQSVVSGAFAWDGADVDGTWLTGELTPDLALYVLGTTDSTLGRAAQLSGGIGGFEGEISSVVFDGVFLQSEGWGGTCPQEPGGMVSVRDVSGDWYDVLFHGPTEWAGAATGACDGCGDAYFRGEPIGTVCADFTALTDWETTPW